MSLSSYRPPQQDIAVGPVTIKVRGLNLNDVARLLAAHESKLAAAFYAFENIKAGVTGDTGIVSQLVLNLVLDAPVLAADIIAIACDEPDASASAMGLPFPVQVQVLSAIATMTFEAGGGLGNFLAALGQISNGLGAAMKNPSSKLDSSAPPLNGTDAPAREIVSGSTFSPSASLQV